LSEASIDNLLAQGNRNDHREKHQPLAHILGKDFFRKLRQNSLLAAGFARDSTKANELIDENKRSQRRRNESDKSDIRNLKSQRPGRNTMRPCTPKNDARGQPLKSDC